MTVVFCGDVKTALTKWPNGCSAKWQHNGKNGANEAAEATEQNSLNGLTCSGRHGGVIGCQGVLEYKADRLLGGSDGRNEGRTDRWTEDKQMAGRTDEQTDRWARDGRMDGRTEMDGQTDGRTNVPGRMLPERTRNSESLFASMFRPNCADFLWILARF